ncbi:peptidylprolyl isomerase [Burkholderia pseudomallei]|uniref:peptidylprolyl isomerase n=1 Tax=Burkholderia pseudomallei TaxID=28450 RepID=UPI001EF0E3E8|nr:peptidylprolyl isomerase [Burkholderia pseudomallei]
MKLDDAPTGTTTTARSRSRSGTRRRPTARDNFVRHVVARRLEPYGAASLTPPAEDRQRPRGERGQYNGTIFHRVIKGFNPGRRREATRADPARASGLKNATGDGASDPNSATAQFFINTVDNAGLDYPNPDGNGYAVFGKVVSGLDVVKKIEATPTTVRGPMRDVPEKPIVIESATIVSK